MLKLFVAAQVMLMQAKPKSRKGQSLTEYGLVLFLIAVACIGALTTMGTKIQGVITQITNALP